MCVCVCVCVCVSVCLSVHNSPGRKTTLRYDMRNVDFVLLCALSFLHAPEDLNTPLQFRPRENPGHNKLYTSSKPSRIHRIELFRV